MTSGHVREQGFLHHVGLILLLLLVIGAAVGAGLWVKSKNDGGSSQAGQQAEASWTKGCTSDERVPMTHLPMRMSDVASFTPYGLTAGAHVTPIDHLYFYPKPGP